MTRFFLAIFLAISVCLSTAAWAQDTRWIQIEARSNQAQALERAGAWAARLPDVNGFAMDTGWNAIVLGPYSEAEAVARLAALRAARAIPSDSYITEGNRFGARFFGLDVAVAAPTEPVAAPEPGEETVAEARRSERSLTREEREEVQIALGASGFYSSVIDADFGPGTRRAMGAWQAANGFEATGVLTTLQRRDLVGTYRDAITTLGLEDVANAEAGVSITLPMGLVSFARNEPPFAQYESAEAGGPRVLLISQSGDRGTLAALFEVLQTLEIMPLEGERRLNRSEFTLTGVNDTFSSHAYARVSDGAIKGYMLVWPRDDAYRKALALTAMQSSFLPTAGVLPDDGGGAQSLDLLAGLQIRKPARALSGFYVSPQGAVLTSASGVDGCGRLEIGGVDTMRVAAVDADKDLALLEPSGPLSPLAHARLTGDEPRLNSDIAVAGFSFGGVLSLPSVTFGTLADVRSLDGDESVHRLALLTEPGDAGGPVFDTTGAVAGMLLPEIESARVLPGDVAFARDAGGLAAFLEANGVAPSISGGGDPLAPEDLATLAADMTVLVTCWN